MLKQFVSIRKIYHFADPLKAMAIDLFDLSPTQVYGTDEDKNTVTPYLAQDAALKGKDVLDNIHMTREFLQYFGTDVMRSIKDTVWVDYTIKKIKQEQSSVAIIPDVRFPNEVLLSKTQEELSSGLTEMFTTIRIDVSLL